MGKDGDAPPLEPWDFFSSLSELAEPEMMSIQDMAAVLQSAANPKK